MGLTNRLDDLQGDIKTELVMNIIRQKALFIVKMYSTLPLMNNEVQLPFLWKN